MIRRRTTPRTQIYEPLKKKARREEKGREEDMITRLPEDICCHILTFLPITHAVATSVLCKKWKNLWTSASFTNLELDDWLLLPSLSTCSASSICHAYENSHSFAPTLTIRIA
ncbi:hypothetical protein ACFX16_030991 [Malus domestica]